MNKIVTLIRAPILTESGYAKHSLEVFEALSNDPVFDVFVESVPWGNCGFVTDDSELIRKVKSCVSKFNQANAAGFKNWDLFVSVTIPNEFERRGKVNIGVTAGIETDRVALEWIQKANEMDLLIVPSEHSKEGFVKTVYDFQNQQTGERGTFRLTTPVEVCHEGVDSGVFKKKELLENKYDFEPDFNFLVVGQWGAQPIGEDRKNIGVTIKWFIETFAGRKDVGLVLKINMSRNSEIDKGHCVARISQIKSMYPPEIVPPIYLIHGQLSQEEMADLYSHPKIKAMLSLSAGEGFCIPMLEAAMCELPVIATNWSGHLDYLNLGKFSPIEFELKNVPKSVVWKGVINEDAMWAWPREADAKQRMKKIVSHYFKPSEWAREARQSIVSKFDKEVAISNLNTKIKSLLLSRKLNGGSPVEEMMAHIDSKDDYNVIYTMPQSTGDVLVSTAVIDGLKKNIPEGAKIYFATREQYADLLKNNPNIHKCIPWKDYMMHIELLEECFDLVLTPNMATQYNFSNWVRAGQGRLLAEEFANHCHSELGDYFIDKDVSVKNELLGEHLYMTFHPGSGKDQWEARRYNDWVDTIRNLKAYYADLKVVQIGTSDEPLVPGVDIDLRGKTNYQQLASVVEGALLHLGIDSFSMHLAAALNTPLVALFGSSHATSTGPWVKNKEKSKYILLESQQKLGCAKACYKSQCKKDKDNPCINEIDSKDIFKACVNILKDNEEK